MNAISLLSLNTFGIPFYLGWERLGRLASYLNRLPFDLVCLQEIQQNAYAPLVERGLTSYSHSAFERYLYAPKGGLAIFSRIPWIERCFEVYRERGTWYSISFADWALYKGIQMVSFEIAGMPVSVLNTHLNANYRGVWHQKNRLTRILHSQVKQLSRAISSFPPDSMVIICGDLNFPRDSYLYKELIAQNHLIDPLVDDQRPTYRPFPLVPSKWKTSLDYMLVRPPRQEDIDVKADQVTIEDTRKKWQVQRFLTDHNALTLEIRWDSANLISKSDDQARDRIEYPLPSAQAISN
jgi:endonuclease/exonuclease/phosphatase family metal-dependent hydrolase